MSFTFRAFAKLFAATNVNHPLIQKRLRYARSQVRKMPFWLALIEINSPTRATADMLIEVWPASGATYASLIQVSAGLAKVLLREKFVKDMRHAGRSHPASFPTLGWKFAQRILKRDRPVWICKAIANSTTVVKHNSQDGRYMIGDAE